MLDIRYQPECEIIRSRKEHESQLRDSSTPTSPAVTRRSKKYQKGEQKHMEDLEKGGLHLTH